MLCPNILFRAGNAEHKRKLSQRIFLYVPVGTVTATLCRVLVFGVGREFNPFQLVAVHEGAGVGAVARLGAFGHELHTHGLHLLVEVGVGEVFHALRVEHVAEVAESLDVDALALHHAGMHHACDVAQHGLNVGVTYGGDLGQILGDGLRFYGLALHDGLGEVDLGSVTERFFPEWHDFVSFLFFKGLLTILIIPSAVPKGGYRYL